MGTYRNSFQAQEPNSWQSMNNYGNKLPRALPAFCSLRFGVDTFRMLVYARHCIGASADSRFSLFMVVTLHAKSLWILN